MMEARLYEKTDKHAVLCRLCAHGCRIAVGRRGICGVRENRDGTLYTLVYGKLIAEHVDPVEKKPMFHFQPGTRSYSIATVGCNFRCANCQNAEISQAPKDIPSMLVPEGFNRGETFEGKLGSDATPYEAAHEAAETGCSSIAYTYTEPTIFFEFAQDTARVAKSLGLKNIFVTNGYMTRQCLDEMKGLLDGANVDLKSASDDFYKKVCGATLAPVRESIEYMRALGVWVEITTLIIPTLNDSEEELKETARWIASVDNAIPWHVSAFHPAYKLMDLPPTSESTVIRAREIGLTAGLKYVYTGNIQAGDGENTYCPACKTRLITRRGFIVTSNLVDDGKCPQCKATIEGVDL
ncbi:MAG: AmmeMemoRadiSam system radical SAM enzyme [Deltaproteobacteria bacterium]|nr:AmmeMemoRadiSam system radical SAM enzyme [Deltaproteobacteria bacterium]